VESILGLVDSMPTFFLFMSIATSFIPIPDFPVILNLAGSGLHPAWLIGLIGGLGTCIGGLIDYLIVAQIRRLERIERLLQHRYYRTIERYFKKYAFLSIAVSDFLVIIPSDPFKLLAATARYNKYKFVAAIFIGRAPRYYLTAVLGEAVRFHPALLGATFLILLAIPIAQYLHRRTRQKGRAATAGDSDTFPHLQ